MARGDGGGGGGDDGDGSVAAEQRQCPRRIFTSTASSVSEARSCSSSPTCNVHTVSRCPGRGRANVGQTRRLSVPLLDDDVNADIQLLLLGLPSPLLLPPLLLLLL
jgi:hypothetical protein